MAGLAPGGAAEVPDSSRPETWFHLIGGNVSKEGLTADLEAIKTAGIGGIQLFHGQVGTATAWPGVPEQIPCLSARWDDMIAHVAAECERLGLSFKMQNCPGWSMSGGPWITPENAMRELVLSRTDVRAGGDVRLPVPAKGSDRPEDRDYRDLFVLAFPTPLDDATAALQPEKTESPSADVRIFTFASPVCVRTVELPSTSALDHARTYDPEMDVTVSAVSDDGTETVVTHQPLPPGNWQDNRGGGTMQTLALDEMTSRRWKVSVRHRDPIRLKDVRLYTGARLNQWEGLAGWTIRGLVDRGVPRQDPSCWIRSSQIVDLTGKMAKDGTLSFAPPSSGLWTILRIGHVNALRRNGPAPAEATGWECSKLSKKGIEANYRSYIGRLVKGPAKGRLAGLVVDSWECYRQNWTDGLDAIFRSRVGTDLKPLLPAVFGWVVDDPGRTERFLRDWRGLLGKLVEENYYGRLAELAHADGLTVQYETSFGDALAGDLLEFWKHADVPMCEFWRPTAPTGVGSHDFKPVKPCVSAAHVYGHGRVAAEALTNCALTWDEKPSDFKTVIDRHFARGVTHLVFHTYTHNPQVGFKRPGTSFGTFIGTPFIRGQDWWKHMSAFTDYVTRCGEFLEAGKPVVDVLRVLGDGLGHKPSEREEHFRNRFKDDYVNKDALMTRLSVRDGMLVLPDGMEYAVLWIPEGTYLDPESVRRIEALERQGAKVVRSGDPTEGLVADVVSPDDRLLWYHRRADGEDRYFVAACDAECAGDVCFRGRRVRLDLEKGESRFVSFGANGVEVVDPVTGSRDLGKCPGLSERTLARCGGETEWRGKVPAANVERVWLDLGTVHGVAEVFVNGKSVATCWCPPWRCELTGCLNAESNDIRVAVATTWYNRLRTDQAKPEAEREYWTVCPPKPDAPALPEGLHGPIRLLSARRADPAGTVNVFVGTDGFGNTLPGPMWPLGMVQPGPDTLTEYWSCCNGYRWKETTVAGFSQTHLSGTGLPEFQDVALLPFSGDISREIAAYREWADAAFRKAQSENRGVPRRTLIRGEMDKRTERGEVGYYAVTLTNWNVRVELTASKRVAYHRYTFASGKDAHVYVNLQSGPSRWWRHAPPDRISGARSAWDARERVLSGCTCPTSMVIDRDVSFALTFSVPPKAARKLEPLDGWKGDRWVFDFDLPDGGSVVAKAAVSTTDEEGAKRNLASDGPGFDFDARRMACRAAWNRLLGCIDIEAPDDRRAQFYTALYHAYGQPNVLSDVDGRYRDGARTVGRCEDFEMYSTFSLWDTFRATHPLYTILTPERAADFARSMVSHQRATGSLPRWEAWGRETGDMVALHSVPVVADAVLKGLPGMDAEAAFGAIDASLADRGPLYDRYGYFPWQEHWRAASVTLEWCYDDWCAAVLAERLGKADRAAFYRTRASYWKNLFDPKTGYMRGKDAAGNWHEPFDPYKQRPTESDSWTKDRPDRRTHDYVEGSALQYTWHVLHDPLGLIAAFGGQKPFYAALDRLFTLPTVLPGQQLTVESTGAIGQYAHGNEHAHHIPYFFPFVGRADRTAEIVREICDKYYLNRPDGVVGNDDCGQMSAWFVFSCLGFYPFNPCGGEYVIGAPQVPRVEVKVNGEGEERRTFTVIAKNLSKENKYVKSVTLNGKPFKGFVLRHDAIVRGGELVFEMTNAASRTE